MSIDAQSGQDPGGQEVDASLAWLAVPTGAALTLLIIVLLGKPLGHVLFPVDTSEFWPSTLGSVKPKPTEEASFLIALLGAILVPCFVLWARDRGFRPDVPRALVFVVQLAVVAVLVLAIFCRQGSVHLGISYFNLLTVVVALAICAAFATVLTQPKLLAYCRSLLAYRSTWLRWVAPLVAVGVTAIWLLPSVEFDSTVGYSQGLTLFDLIFTFDEGLSVFNGHTPLVDYVSQYGSLWPYVVSIPMHIDHGTVGDFTISMATITLVVMMAIYGVIRRVVESPIATLVLFLAFMATSFFILQGTPIVRYSFADYFGMFPLRYALPFFELYLLARYLNGERPRRLVWVFLVGGLAVLNNGDFGIPALGATVIAVVAAADEPRTRQWWGRRVGEALAGLFTAFLLVSIVTLTRTGELPNVALEFRYAHLFALAGYNLLPMPWFGTWVAIYLTYCAALVCAALLMTRQGARRIEIGALAWVGIFGLGVGSYYAGRSNPEVLVAMFTGWGLAIVLLLVVTTRDLVRRGARPGPAQLALFAGFGLMVCSLAQFPAPWQSIERLQQKDPEILRQTNDSSFIAAHTKHGEPVALITNSGQRLSDEADVDDVTPYSGIPSMPTKGQLSETLERLSEEGGSKVFLRDELGTWPELLPALEHAGFRQITATEPPAPEGQFPADRIILLSNAR